MRKFLIAVKSVQSFFLLLFSLSFLPIFSREQLALLHSLSRLGHTASNIVFVRRILLLLPNPVPFRHDIALIAFFWGLLELVEALGLWKRKVWAENLVIVATGVFIPVEIHTLITKFSLVKLLLTVVNFLIVGWLIFNRRKNKNQI